MLTLYKKVFIMNKKFTRFCICWVKKTNFVNLLYFNKKQNSILSLTQMVGSNATIRRRNKRLIAIEFVLKTPEVDDAMSLAHFPSTSD